MSVIACSTSAFKMPLDEALANVKRLGFGAVDLIGIKSWGQVDLAALADDFEKETGFIEQLLAKHGLTPAALNFSFTHAHQRTDPEVNAQRLREVDAAARLMKRLGIATGSFYPGYKDEEREWEVVMQDCVATYREVLSIAAEHGVKMAPELHFATPFETVEQGRKLIEAMPELPVVYDPSHYAMQGEPMEAARPFLERAIHVHVRDAAPEQMVAPAGEGTVDFKAMVAILNECGYSGNYSVEYLPGKAGDDYEDLVKMRDLLSELI